MKEFLQDSSTIKTGRLADFVILDEEWGNRQIVAKAAKLRVGLGNRLRSGVRYHLYKMSQLQVGDRVVIIAHNGLSLNISGAAAVCSAGVEFIRPGGPANLSNCYIAYLYRPGKLKIKIKGKPRTKIVIPVTEPALPATRATAPGAQRLESHDSQPGGYATLGAQALCGPLQPQLAFPDSEVLHPFDRFIFAVDLVAESGNNFLSLCPLSYWNNSGSIEYQYLPPAPFVKVNGKYDLRRIDPTYRKVLTAMFWRAARAGIALDWYLLDHVSFTHDWMWNKHPLNAANNVHGWISADGCSCGYNKTWALNATHKYESVPKGCGSTEMRAVFATMLRNLAGLVPKELRGRVRVGVGIETESRTFDWWVVTQIIRPLALRAISNLKDWYSDNAFDEGWMPGILETDQRWRELAQAVDVVTLHGCDSGGETARRLARLFQAAQRYNFDLLASTDGAGLGSPKRRPEGDRPNVDDLESAWQEGMNASGPWFGGLEIKHLGLADLRETLPAIAKKLKS
jgi:hypothetical protein